MKINGPIQRKLALLDDRIGNLEAWIGDLSYDAFKSDLKLQAAAERSLQVAIEIVIDIAERLLALRDRGPAASAKEAIQKCVASGLLKDDEPYVKMIGFRNFIVHQYDEIDPTITYDILRNHLQVFRHFRDEIDQLT